MAENVAYDQWHAQYMLEDDTNSSWHLFIKETLREQDLKGCTVLEIACGRGGLSNHLLSRPVPPANLFACDFSAAALDIARQRFNQLSHVTWQQEDIQQLTFQACQFDTIISCETIEHVPDPGQALHELYRVLKPGGRLLLTCPNYFNLFGLWCTYRRWIGKPYTEGQPFVNYLLYPSLRKWLRQAGFRVVSVRTSNLVLPIRAHYHFFTERLPAIIRFLGFRTYFILEK